MRTTHERSRTKTEAADAKLARASLRDEAVALEIEIAAHYARLAR